MTTSTAEPMSYYAARWSRINHLVFDHGVPEAVARSWSHARAGRPAHERPRPSGVQP